MDAADDTAGRPVVVIGNFDGVHRGHLAVLEAARRLAGPGPVVAVTFEPHPLVVLRPDRAPAVLTPLPEKVRLLRLAGADEVVVLPFDTELANWSPGEFVERVLVERLRARIVVVGENFRFGHRAAGDVPLLRRLGTDAGFEVVPAPLATVPDGSRVSSSLIRERLAAGDVEAARAALGRPYRLFGLVVRGDARGRELGYPTANLDVTDGVAGTVAVPADGIYAVRFLRSGDLEAAPVPPVTGPAVTGAAVTGPAVTGAAVTGPHGPVAGAAPPHPADGATGAGLPATLSIGTNPTFDGVERRIEANVLDRTDLDLYDQRVALDLIAHQRPTVRFDSAETLIDQMALDTALTREILGLASARSRSAAAVRPV